MSGPRASQTAPASSPPCPVLLLIVVLGVACSLPAAPASAELRVVTAQGEHHMGDRDTREDAVRLATEQAKRHALEQVATYLESITVVDGLDITKDEIRTYTAGLVLVLDQQTLTTLDGNTVVVKTDLVAQIDTDEVAHAIAALRENEDARHQLVALKQENDQLQQQLDAANQALANATTADQAQQATQQRQDLLDRVQSNAMVSQAWTDWVLVSPAVYPSPWIGLAQTQALLNVARSLYPASPHVTTAQQVFTTKQPPIPPQPPTAPAPGTTQPIMPSHQIVPPPGSTSPPRTLNEIVLSAPSTPTPAGRQTHPSQDARIQSFLRHNPNWGLPGHGSAAPGFSEHHAGGQPPTSRPLPPTINQIHPPHPHQVPRVPYQIAPRASGGGYHGGASGGTRRGR